MGTEKYLPKTSPYTYFQSVDQYKPILKIKRGHPNNQFLPLLNILGNKTPLVLIENGLQQLLKSN